MNTNDRLEPTVFAIFGGMAELTWRKLAPALFELSQDRSAGLSMLINPSESIASVIR